jgi:hypothetical protein
MPGTENAILKTSLDIKRTGRAKHNLKLGYGVSQDGGGEL